MDSNFTSVSFFVKPVVFFFVKEEGRVQGQYMYLFKLDQKYGQICNNYVNGLVDLKVAYKSQRLGVQI